MGEAILKAIIGILQPQALGRIVILALCILPFLWAVYFVVVLNPLDYFSGTQRQPALEAVLKIEVPIVIATVFWPVVLAVILQVTWSSIHPASWVVYFSLVGHSVICALLGINVLYQPEAEASFSAGVSLSRNSTALTVIGFVFVSTLIALTLVRGNLKLFKNTADASLASKPSKRRRE